MDRAGRQIDQREFVAQQPPAALAEQRRQRRFARPEWPDHQQRAPVALDARGMEQQPAPRTQRHLQVHPHLGREQPMASGSGAASGKVKSPRTATAGRSQRRHGRSGSSRTVKSAMPSRSAG